MSNYINPFLNSKLIERKKRSDRLHDIKIPVSKEVHEYLNYQAVLKCVSVTKLSTLIFEKTLQNNHHFVEINYLRSNLMVHVHLNTVDYQQVRLLANEWNCSIREAAYIIFQYGLRAVHL